MASMMERAEQERKSRRRRLEEAQDPKARPSGKGGSPQAGSSKGSRNPKEAGLGGKGGS